MAERTGGARKMRRSIPAELRQRSSRDIIESSPASAGALSSPQKPGRTPDFSDIPAHLGAATPRPAEVHRPKSQDGTAQEMAGIYQPGGPGGTWVAADFQPASPSPEEMRRANPALNTPKRPARAIAAPAKVEELPG